MILCSHVISALPTLLARYQLRLQLVADGASIPGSHWGEPEAGLVGDTLYIRGDTPLHSVLHEAAHFICMDPGRREVLDTDAGGDYEEENGVCYLQILLARELDVAVDVTCADMDTWGYTFRLGNAAAWFNEDAVDARDWLWRHGLITADGRPSWRRRETLAAVISPPLSA
jgi:hypothetical protein